MTSMTGYSYIEQTGENISVSVEIKSVNSRFLDLTINLPPFLNPLESFFRDLITQKVVRGKVDVFIRIKENESDVEIKADKKAAKAYYEAVKEISDSLGYIQEIPISLIISQPGVLNSCRNYDVEKYREIILPVFNQSLDVFIKDRMREGENLKKDLLEKLVKLEECALFFKEWQPKMEAMFKEQITKKFNELLGDSADENRIMTETAAMLVKYTINEEIVRLLSHLKAMKDEINSNPVPGKKLDFICQEINREINTIGSKNQFTEVGTMVITAKDSIENIREQSKNIE
ncbi:MAG: YicC family protein [Treponema sp.]|uniref:YicC/YloC family endoribonuclease n=1 Tax=Treponema sp. TaxID=166 RepID=UPI001B68F933|nr:YicC/YloC family endoribonuclease [Treponema sp.]MBP5403079.1 YicC family protein [Treponema sp.]MBR5934298.1 YicC family protein [Treponema sp.]